MARKFKLVSVSVSKKVGVILISDGVDIWHSEGRIIEVTSPTFEGFKERIKNYD